MHDIRQRRIKKLDEKIVLQHLRNMKSQNWFTMSFIVQRVAKYRVSQKKMFPCLRGYNSDKNGTTIKSKMSFKIYMQFSF